VNLKRLIYRELGEGLTEKDLALAVGVTPRTIANILADRIPKNPAVWKRFAKYFRMDVDFLRTGRVLSLTKPSGKKGAALPVQMRRVPLLTWDHLARALGSEKPVTTAEPEIMLETDVPGTRAFALRVTDDSMNPLFSEGEVIFVDPDLEVEPGHYVIAGNEAVPANAMLRELRELGGQPVLHPLNRHYRDMPVGTGRRIWGRVIRLRKNL
jgi:SOS-response transcriptional repressor LexA